MDRMALSGHPGAAASGRASKQIEQALATGGKAHVHLRQADSLAARAGLASGAAPSPDLVQLVTGFSSEINRGKTHRNEGLPASSNSTILTVISKNRIYQ